MLEIERRGIFLIRNELIKHGSSLIAFVVGTGLKDAGLRNSRFGFLLSSTVDICTGVYIQVSVPHLFVDLLKLGLDIHYLSFPLLLGRFSWLDIRKLVGITVGLESIIGIFCVDLKSTSAVLVFFFSPPFLMLGFMLYVVSGIGRRSGFPGKNRLRIIGLIILFKFMGLINHPPKRPQV